MSHKTPEEWLQNNLNAKVSYTVEDEIDFIDNVGGFAKCCTVNRRVALNGYLKALHEGVHLFFSHEEVERLSAHCERCLDAFICSP